VPVETANLNVFVIQLLDPRSHYQQIDNSGGDVDMCRPGNGEEGRAKTTRVGSRPSEVVNVATQCAAS